MTEFNAETFALAKEGYKKEHDSFELLVEALHESLEHPGKLSQQDIGENNASLSFLDLAASSVEAERGHKSQAREFYKEALDHYEKARKLHVESGNLDMLLNKVKVEIN